MKLRISRALQMQMLAEAAASPDREVCGLLFGASGDRASVHLTAHVEPPRHAEPVSASMPQFATQTGSEAWTLKQVQGDGARISASPIEICHIQPCPNVSPNPDRAFEIDPAALIHAHKAERTGGPMLIGCYHSHPNGVLALSPDDLASATERQIWVLMAGGTLAAWQCLIGKFQKIAIEPVTMLLATA
jgi:desampylase